VLVVLVQVVRGAPGEVAAHLDLRGDVTEDIADILEVDDGLERAGGVPFAKSSANS
jgi:hypothetical protein